MSKYFSHQANCPDPKLHLGCPIHVNFGKPWPEFLIFELHRLWGPKTHPNTSYIAHRTWPNHWKFIEPSPSPNHLLESYVMKYFATRYQNHKTKPATSSTWSNMTQIPYMMYPCAQSALVLAITQSHLVPLIWTKIFTIWISKAKPGLFPTKDFQLNSILHIFGLLNMMPWPSYYKLHWTSNLRLFIFFTYKPKDLFKQKLEPATKSNLRPSKHTSNPPFELLETPWPFGNLPSCHHPPISSYFPLLETHLTPWFFCELNRLHLDFRTITFKYLKVLEQPFHDCNNNFRPFPFSLFTILVIGNFGKLRLFWFLFWCD